MRKLGVKDAPIGMKMKKEYLECGKICNAHGVRGLLKVESWCDTPSVLAKQKRVYFEKRDGSYEERSVVSASVMGELVLMNIDGVQSREDAIALKNKVLFLHRSDIPVKRGAMLIADMIGLPVIHAESGERLGTLKSVDDAARGMIYTVATEKKDVLIPAVDEFIKEIDPERGVAVLPIPGFFDDADEV